MTRTDRDLLEEVLGAWRPHRADGAGAHPAWHDLPLDLRTEAFHETRRLRAMEAAMNPDGLSTTARAVLARIRAGTPRAPHQ